LGLKSIFDGNGGNKTVYGFVTNAEQWIVIKYNKQYLLSHKYTYLYPGVEKQEEKLSWVENNTRIGDVIKTILTNY
jgi:hypothetical protein